MKRTVAAIIIHKIEGPDNIRGKTYKMCCLRDRYFTLSIKYSLGLQLRLKLITSRDLSTLFISRLDFSFDI